MVTFLFCCFVLSKSINNKHVDKNWFNFFVYTLQTDFVVSITISIITRLMIFANPLQNVSILGAVFKLVHG